MVNTVISCVVVVLVFVAVLLVVLWGDSKRADNNRTVADVIMSPVAKLLLDFIKSLQEFFLRLCMLVGLLF